MVANDLMVCVNLVLGFFVSFVYVCLLPIIAYRELVLEEGLVHNNGCVSFYSGLSLKFNLHLVVSLDSFLYLQPLDLWHLRFLTQLVLGTNPSSRTNSL
jgi:hypothetical protein